MGVALKAPPLFDVPVTIGPSASITAILAPGPAATWRRAEVA